MNTNFLTNVNTFANEFVSTIMEGNDQASSGYEWDISFDMGFVKQDLTIETMLSLHNGDGEEVGHIVYDVVRGKNKRYDYMTTFSFGDVVVYDDDQEEREFEIMKDIFDSCEDGLYDKICAYLHKYTMEQMECGKDVEASWPPTYAECYSIAKIKRFMEKYRISPYVPIVLEVQDDEGMPSKYLTIKNLGFNDESNELFVFLSERKG